MLAASIVGCISGRNVGEKHLCDPLGMRSEKKKRLHKFSCYKAEDAPRAIGSRSRRKDVGSFSASFWSDVLNPIGAGVIGVCEVCNTIERN